MNAFPSVFLPVFPSSHNLPSFLPKPHHSLIFFNQDLSTARFHLFSLQPVADWFSSLGFPLTVHGYPIWYPSSPYLVPSKCGTLLKDYQQGLCRSAPAVCCAAWFSFRAALEAHQNKDEKKILQLMRFVPVASQPPSAWGLRRGNRLISVIPLRWSEVRRGRAPVDVMKPTLS